VTYGEYAGLVDIQTQELMEGDLPQTALSLVKEWTKKYQNELLNIWNTQNFAKLPPLE
jgi:hypothetical protein